MEKVATDIYSFRELRKNGFTYVDKTAMLLPLCDSMLHALFEGQRDLFRASPKKSS